ncbi:MAG: protein kinase [Gemmataceae bacterium]|nr:protein kinase [Gemmataceae bacterium]
MNSISRCPDQRQMEAFLRGALSGPDIRRIRSHVEACAACQGVLLCLGAHQAVPAVADRLEDCNTPSISQDPSAPSRYPFLLPAVLPDELGRLGPYRVLRLLGEGGMGLVFHAEDIALNRPVALKVLKPQLNGGNGWQRFLREARTLAAIKHERLVTIFQAGQEGEVAYFAMELLQGESLEDKLKWGRPLEVDEILRIGREIASGLAALHAKNVLHRDLKPANIWLESPHQRVKILDLGLARTPGEGANLTRSGTLLGTPSFMSPEQARGEPLDARSDLFSLGCILYCLCTGTRPFQGGTTMAILTSLALSAPEPAHDLNPRIPRPLSDLVKQLMAKNLKDRPGSANTVRKQLEWIGRQLHDPTPAPGATPRPGLKTFSLLETVREPERRLADEGGQPWGKILLALGIAFGVAFGAHTLGIGFSIVPASSVTPGTPLELPPGAMYLQALKEVGRKNWPFLPPPHPNGEQPGEVVRVKGRVTPHGIFMHPPAPPGGYASLSYSLGRQFGTFQSEVSLNDGPPRSETPCTFWVYGDGRLLWKSAPLSTQEDAQSCAVSVKGVDVLTIAVSCPGEPRGAHAVWVDPYVARGK